MSPFPHSPSSPGRFPTLRVIAASLVAILLAAVAVQMSGATDGYNRAVGTESLALPALAAFLGLGIFATLFRKITGRVLLTRAEWFCVLFAALVATPLMTLGFWRFLLSTVSTIPRAAEFAKYDALNEKLWPHGPNLLDGWMTASPQRPSAVTTFGDVQWQSGETRRDRKEEFARLTNRSAGETAGVRFTLPVDVTSAKALHPGQPYLIAALVRAESLLGSANYYCRLRLDQEAGRLTEVFVGRESPDVTYLQSQGFRRVGTYAFTIPAETALSVTVEFGLEGEGQIDLADPHFIEVSALEDAFLGRRLVRHSEYEALPPGERRGLTIRPDSPWSWEGLSFLFFGYFPWREWARPAAAWVSFFAIYLTAIVAITAIVRRQWIRHERFPLPYSQIPAMLLGTEEAAAGFFTRIWYNRYFWGGLIPSALWCLWRVARVHYTVLPNVGISIQVKSYLDQAMWGKTWNDATFSISALALGLALFIELNVLVSIGLGYLLFRLQYWFGESRGLTVDDRYPYFAEQQKGSILSYGLLTVWFIRRYLWQTLQMAWRGDSHVDESISYRLAYGLIVTAFVAGAGWAIWMGYPVWQILLLLAMLLLSALVAARLRAECGTTASCFAAIPILGGVLFWGPDLHLFIAMLLCLLMAQGFFHWPGLQLELMQVGRRLQLPRHWMLSTAFLGLFGGLLIGGWVFLSTTYSVGAQSYVVTGDYEPKLVMLAPFNISHTVATESMTGVAATSEKALFDKPTLGWLGGAGLTTALVFLRQAFGGFWFHPVGYMIGPSEMAKAIWGSFLSAALLRFAVLRLGGAASVREKLQPAGAGMVVGVVAAWALVFLFYTGLYLAEKGGARYWGGF